MLTINAEKLNRIKQLASKQTIKPSMLIKLIHSEIIDMRGKYTLKEILLLINFEFEQKIEYVNFQRMLNRMEEEKPSPKKKPKILNKNDEDQKPLNINTMDVDTEQLI